MTNPTLHPPQADLAKEEHEAAYFIQCYEGAKKYGLEKEFVSYFIRDFTNTKDVYAACWYAYCEWDL